MAKITLIGFYNYTDGGIFDGLQVPEGLTKSTLVDRIIFEYGEFEPIYANSTYLAHAITNWYNTHKWDMERSWNVLSAEYEPLWNYDRTETATSSGTIGDEASTSSESSGTGSRENEHKVSAYDSSTYSPDNTDSEETTNKAEASTTGTSTRTEQHTNTVTAHGNIGITSSQQMLLQELEVCRNNWYETYAAMFAADFLIMVY